MKSALLFRDSEKPIIVSAEDVKSGRYSRYDEYVDPEYEFRVAYVKAAKHGGGPYFRLYYSYEDYKNLYPDRADRYQLVANMRRYEESEWHTHWKNRVASFCDIEKTIPNKELRKWKIADAYYADAKTCIEFQHSYISFHFEEKNEFYRTLSLETIWLYDLTNSNIKRCSDGSIEILEDNARGFFRISEVANNLRNNFVYIQVKTGNIYRITELDRRETLNNLKSTIRYFWPSEIYTEQEFVAAIQSNSLKKYEDILTERESAARQRHEQEVEQSRKQQEAEKQRLAQEAEILRLQQERERQRLAQEAEILKRQQESERQPKQNTLQHQGNTERIAQEDQLQAESSKKIQEEAEKRAEETVRQQENAIRQKMQYADYEQSDYDVLDFKERRWIRCRFCKEAVLFEKETSTYIRGSNKGTCFNCRFKR